MQKAICSAENFLNKHDYVFEKKHVSSVQKKQKFQKKRKIIIYTSDIGRKKNEIVIQK